MNWTLLFELSGIVFWILILIIIIYAIYDRVETEFFIWHHKYKWKRYYKKTFKT